MLVTVFFVELSAPKLEFFLVIGHFDKHTVSIIYVHFLMEIGVDLLIEA
jgi:hypothetical protein